MFRPGLCPSTQYKVLRDVGLSHVFTRTFGPVVLGKLRGVGGVGGLNLNVMRLLPTHTRRYRTRRSALLKIYKAGLRVAEALIYSRNKSVNIHLAKLKRHKALHSSQLKERSIMFVLFGMWWCKNNSTARFL